MRFFTDTVIMKCHCYFDFSLISDLYEYDIPILNVFVMPCFSARTDPQAFLGSCVSTEATGQSMFDQDTTLILIFF